MNSLQPFCSIIVLNYFGEKVLKNTIESLLKLNYLKERLEIIIVDNNSQDKSREIIKEYSQKETNIKYLFLNRNKGFAGGNNEGIKIAQGEYVVLLNNDCVVLNNWLSELVKIAQKDSKIFAVSSKIKLYPKYYYLKFNYSNNMFLAHAILNNSQLSKLEKQQKKIYLSVIKKDDFCYLEIPYAPNDQIIYVEIIFDISQQDFSKSTKELFTLLRNEKAVIKPKKTISEKKFSIGITLDIRKFNPKSIYERIQNAGIVIFQDGSGRDIGARIINHKQDYEYDFGQYENEKEIYAACGAAVLYNKKILDKIGFLDESFFMYYEDVEISERARFRGYKILYSPKAEVRHLHAFSSREWSNFFLFQVEKGRLLHVFFNFPFYVFIKEYLRIILKIGQVGAKILKGLSDVPRVIRFIMSMVSFVRRPQESEGNSKIDFGRVMQYIKILLYFITNLPILIIKRYKKRKGLLKNAVNNNYQNIIKGRWYFN